MISNSNNWQVRSARAGAGRLKFLNPPCPRSHAYYLLLSLCCTPTHGPRAHADTKNRSVTITMSHLHNTAAVCRHRRAPLFSVHYFRCPTPSLSTTLCFRRLPFSLLFVLDALHVHDFLFPTLSSPLLSVPDAFLAHYFLSPTAFPCYTIALFFIITARAMSAYFPLVFLCLWRLFPGVHHMSTIVTTRSATTTATFVHVA